MSSEIFSIKESGDKTGDTGRKTDGVSGGNEDKPDHLLRTVPNQELEGLEVDLSEEVIDSTGMGKTFSDTTISSTNGTTS